MDRFVDRYRLVGEVGRGSTGTVYLGYDDELDRPVAIKQLARALARDPVFLERFRGEGQTMARLAHPNCIQVYGLVETEGDAYLVTEYVDGAALREVLGRSGKLTPEQALGVLHGSLSGLAHAHSVGIVHRDVKPDNIMCEPTGNSKLGDFGLAAPIGTVTAGPAFGSPAYMSPEQVRGEPTTERSDVYSAGATLYELLTGQPPYSGDTPLAVMRQQLSKPPPRAPRGLVPAVAGLVARAMAKDPAARPAGATAFAAELEVAATTAYGPDWRRRAGIAEAVAGAIAAGAAAATALGGAVASGALGAAASGATGVADVATAAGGLGATAPVGSAGPGPPGGGGRRHRRCPVAPRRPDAGSCAAGAR